MVEVAIIDILAALAIPTFLGQREGAQDRNAQSSLRNAATIARAIAAKTDGVYTGTSDEFAEEPAEDEPLLTLEDAASDSADAVSVHVVNEQTARHGG